MGLVLIAAIALINGLLFRVKTVTVDFDTETSIQAEEGEAEKSSPRRGSKRKNIFGVSESRMIKNINAALPGVRVVNIERIFPNRIVIHVSKRVPVYLMKYRQNTSDAAKYVVVDGDMVVLGFYDDKPDEQSFVFVDGFELVGKYTIETGRTLPVEFGKSIYYLQNVAAGLYNCKLTPAQFIAFIEKVRFENDVIDLCTRSGVVMRLGGNLTTEQVSERVPLAFSWYKSLPEDSEKKTSKYIAIYNSSKTNLSQNLRTENKKTQNTAARRVFYTENGLLTREYAFICVYGHIVRANMRIYAKYIIKSFVKRLTHTRTHAIMNI